VFAKNCRKDNGLFKCCQHSASLGQFQNTRQKLYSAGLIKKDAAEDVISPEDANVLRMTFFCTYKDHLGDAKHRFKSPSTNPIGGIVFKPDKRMKSRIEYRALQCATTNLCSDYEVYKDEQLFHVSSKREYCDLERNIIKENKKYAEVKVEGLMEPEADCMKRKSPVRICPTKTIKGLGSEPMVLQRTHFNVTREVDKIMKKFQQKKKRKKKKKRSIKKKKKKGKKRRKKRGKRRTKKKKERSRRSDSSKNSS